jgi:two-component sensor histidine kinase
MSEKSRTELEVALAEATHRARNDLQAVSAMLRLQATVSTDPAVKSALIIAENRVQALASLNSRLDQWAGGAETVIDSRQFLEGLSADIQATYFDQRPITIQLRAERHPIPLEHARPLGLVINELVVNAVKYAFPEGAAGTISIVFGSTDREAILIVEDDGIGFDPGQPPRGSGLGRFMIDALVAQIGGWIATERSEPGGTRCTIGWPGMAEPLPV